MTFCVQNIDIRPEIKPENINLLKIDESIDKIKNWYNETKEEVKVSNKEVLLEMEDVKFGYEKGKEILHGVSFKINKGEMVSVVGKMEQENLLYLS